MSTDMLDQLAEERHLSREDLIERSLEPGEVRVDIIGLHKIYSLEEIKKLPSAPVEIVRDKNNDYWGEGYASVAKTARHRRRRDVRRYDRSHRYAMKSMHRRLALMDAEGTGPEVIAKIAELSGF